MAMPAGLNWKHLLVLLILVFVGWTAYKKFK
jgi:hypothetical protein